MDSGIPISLLQNNLFNWTREPGKMTEKTYNAVQCCYGNIAKNTTQDDSQGKIATAFGYSASDLASLPEKTNLGVSCGNPVAYANMKEVCKILMTCNGMYDIMWGPANVYPFLGRDGCWPW